MQEKISEVKVYLRWHRFPPELAARVKRYFEFYFSRNSAMDEQEILAHLAPTLRRLVLQHLLIAKCHAHPALSKSAQYVTVDLCQEVHSKIRPLLREANESIMESLDKGADGGPSVFFVRRGSLSALASIPDVLSLTSSAGTANGCVAIIGEHALMAKNQCMCTWGPRATTRCELYAFGDDLPFRNSAPGTGTDHVDEMADIIYAEFARRHLIRALALRMVVALQRRNQERAHLRVTHNEIQSLAALQLQTCWIHRIARRLSRQELDSSSIATIMPGLYLGYCAPRKEDNVEE